MKDYKFKVKIKGLVDGEDTELYISLDELLDNYIDGSHGEVVSSHLFTGFLDKDGDMIYDRDVVERKEKVPISTKLESFYSFGEPTAREVTEYAEVKKPYILELCPEARLSGRLIVKRDAVELKILT